MFLHRQAIKSYNQNAPERKIQSPKVKENNSCEYVNKKILKFFFHFFHFFFYFG